MSNATLGLAAIVGGFLISIIASPAFSSERILNYDEAWEEGRFNSKSLKDVVELYPMPDNVLNEYQKECLIKSKTLTHLKILDLNRQKIDDSFIESICNNPTFSRIIELDLSYNPEVTNLSLKHIQESETLGSIRESPQISGTYGSAFSDIDVRIEGTSIKSEIVNYYQENPRFDFLIKYLDPITDHRTAPSVEQSIKWLHSK
jgi:hypothetical protein